MNCCAALVKLQTVWDMRSVMEEMDRIEEDKTGFLGQNVINLIENV